MSANNINRSETVRGEAAQVQPGGDPSIPTLLWRLVKSAAYYVLRLNFAIFLLVYYWCVKVLNRALEPFQPIANEVGKVPKKDVSVEGIFYQFLRLQFLVALFLSPFVMTILHFVTRPLAKIRDRIVQFMEEEKVGEGSFEPTGHKTDLN